MKIKNNFLSITNLSTSLVLLASSYGRAADFTIESGGAVTSQQILESGEVGAIASGGILNVSTGDAVLFDGVVNGARLVNNGTITTTGDDNIAILEYDNGSANNIIINNGTVETGGASSYGVGSYGSYVTITNIGSITTSGDDSTGIISSGTNANITNEGRLTTSGDSSIAIISSGANATITNSGTINTSLDDANGILSNGEDLTINNSGSITTSGIDSTGIVSLKENADITNSGTITTSGYDSHAIRSIQENVNITNSGTITTSGDNSAAIVSIGGEATITNSALIITSGTISDGITSSGVNATITNSGTISVSGANSIAINLDSTGGDNSTLTNSGKIFATSNATAAIAGGTGAQTLFLGKGSQIIGTVDLGGGTDSITVTGNGISGRLVTSNVETLTLGAGVAGAISGNTIHTVDPTGSAMLTTNVNNLSLNLHKIANSRTSQESLKNPIWLQVFGSSFNRGADDGNLDYKSSHRGIIGGYELDSNSDSSSVNGIMFGLSSGDMKTKSESFNIDSTSVFIGAYKNFNLSRTTILSTTILAGYEQYESKRRLVDNINGFQTARSDFDNIFISPAVALEHRFKLNDMFEIAPEARVAYTSSFFGNQKEKGASANLNTKSRNAQILNSRAGIKAVMNLSDYQLELGAGLDNRIIKEGDVRANIDGAGLRYDTNNDKNVNGRYFKLSIRSGDLKGISLLANFEKRYADGNEDEAFGQFSASYKF